MKRHNVTLIIVLAGWMLLVCGLAPVPCEELPPWSDDAFLKGFVGTLSLEEKAAFVVGTGMTIPGGSRTTPATVAGEAEKLVPGAAGTTYPIPHLGISAMVLADGPAGLRISPTRENDMNTYYCTAFPVATLLASTWNTDLVYAVGKAIGDEVLEYGVDILLAPALNIHRNPLCGRNFEYYSEDPLISGKMAAAMVEGVESMGVGATLKHFAANNAETNRMALDTIVSQRALREIYLEGFRIAVEEGKPWAVMSAYNKINGTFCSESHDLLTGVLRNDWGFKGFVMTDWFGGSDPVAQVQAGNDLLMPGNPKQSEKIVAAVKEGRLDEESLTTSAARIFTKLIESPRFIGHPYGNKPPLAQHAVLARQAAAEGMVLLKNEKDTLPLSKDIRNIAVFGNSAYDIITGGTGSGDVNEAYSVSLVEGLGNAGYAVDATLTDMYAGYLKALKEKRRAREGIMIMAPPEPLEEMGLGPDLAKKMAGMTDIAIITIGRNSGEFSDRTSGEGDFALSKAEADLVRTVTEAFHQAGKKCIVILNVGGVIETASWRDIPDAILLAWQAGQETGNAMVDILSGKVNPSGRLASTFPISYGDVPSAKTFPGTVLAPASGKSGEEESAKGLPVAKPSEVIYEEGIYVGYRYYDTFGVDTAYPFGYGLSYTRFAFGNLKTGSKKFQNTLHMSLEIKNIGNVAGKEVVQLYIHAPGKTLEKPEEELKGFVKTRKLQPGEAQTVEFNISARQLASFDTASSSWIAEAGRYEARVGASSKDIRLTSQFDLPDAIQVKTESNVLAPSKTIIELTRKKQRVRE